MKELEISLKQRQKANHLYQFYDLHNSITKGKHQYYGAIGEVLVHDYFHHKGYSMSFSPCYNYDMTINNSRVEVKTAKTTVTPQINYLCNIPAYNTHQDCDYYFFVRVLDTLKKGWILGYCSREDFYNKSQFKHKGDSEINGFVYKVDDYVIAINQLTPPKFYK